MSGGAAGVPEGLEGAAVSFGQFLFRWLKHGCCWQTCLYLFYLFVFLELWFSGWEPTIYSSVLFSCVHLLTGLRTSFDRTRGSGTTGSTRPCHGSCGQTHFYMFVYCDLVVGNQPLNCQNLCFLLPFQRQPRKGICLYCSLLVLKRIYHYWKYARFFQGA